MVEFLWNILFRIAESMRKNQIRTIQWSVDETRPQKKDKIPKPSPPVILHYKTYAGATIKLKLE